MILSSYTRDFIPFDLAQIPTMETAQAWPHLSHLSEQMAPLQGCGVGLLLGYNCPQALTLRATIAGKDNEPFAVKTDLDWSIVDGQGLSNSTTCHRIKVTELPAVTPREALLVLQKDFSETEQEDRMVSQEDVKFLKILDTGIAQMEDGHLKIPLPFRSSEPLLPNNKRTAANRLECFKRKFLKNPSYHKDYTEFMQAIIRDGEAGKVEDPGKEGQVWYIPHHGVYHPKKPGKIRVDFDCSARHGSVSLNGQLLAGPDLINSLAGVLLRFREHLVALMCDIQKMFHQFLVKEEHRDYLKVPMAGEW